MKIYDLRTDGVYVPVRYYHHAHCGKVVLVGMLHVAEKNCYEQIRCILEKCDAVIYEEPFPRDDTIMEELDREWASVLFDENVDEAFLAAIHLPMPPQKFIQDHGLRQGAHSFDYNQPHWVSGDGTWGVEKDATLPEEAWGHIRQRIKSVDTALKIEKINSVKAFLVQVNAGIASMRDYVECRNHHEEAIQKLVHQQTIVDPRDNVTFHVFDQTVEIRKPSRIGIQFGNGHIEHMDQLLRERAYLPTSTKWLRALTFTQI